VVEQVEDRFEEIEWLHASIPRCLHRALQRRLASQRAPLRGLGGAPAQKVDP
jgi:hypothetical protein